MPRPLRIADADLASKLAGNAKIDRRMRSIPWSDLRLRDTAAVAELDRAIGAEIAGDPALGDAWVSERSRLVAALNQAIYRDRNVATALILAGAAIARPGIELRDDLHHSVYTARQAFWAAKVSTPEVDDSGVLLMRRMPPTTSPDVMELADIYQKLADKMTPGGKVDTAIETILTDKTKKILLGDPSLNKLDVSEVQKARDKSFRSRTVTSFSGLPRPGQKQQLRSATAPSELTFRTTKFECLAENEAFSDEIFWLIWFYKIGNLDDVYSQIEAAINMENSDEFELDIDWDVSLWKSELFGDVDDDDPPRSTNQPAWTARIKNGFCPWHCTAMCIEDDNQEYEAVSDVFDAIGDVAASVRQGASYVAQVAGPTMAGAAAAAVGTAAALVEVVTAVADAIVSIVNFFDDDDTIGFATFQGVGDYYNVPAGHTDDYSATLGNVSIGKFKILALEECSSDLDSFYRAWRLRQRITNQKSFHKDPFGLHGGSGEVSVTLKFPDVVDFIANSGVTCSEEAGVRHAEWVRGPNLQADHITVKGKVHWGVSWENSITFSPWAEGWKFWGHL